MRIKNGYPAWIRTRIKGTKIPCAAVAPRGKHCSILTWTSISKATAISKIGAPGGTISLCFIHGAYRLSRPRYPRIAFACSQTGTRAASFRYKHTNKKKRHKASLFIGALGRNRTGTGLLPTDFKSAASTCSATSASLISLIHKIFLFCNIKLVFFLEICLIVSRRKITLIFHQYNKHDRNSVSVFLEGEYLNETGKKNFS